MYISKIALNSFRNFTMVDEIVLPKAALMVAAAPNATGKTNFLEAIVMLLRGKSWRGRHADCVQWGSDSFIIRGVIEKNNGPTTLAVRYHTPSKKLRVEENGVPVSPVTFYSRYPFILFEAQDSFLFTRSPAQRRNFLNRVLVSQPAYVSALVQYQRVLIQRNARLKQAKNYNEIAAWTDLLAEHGTILWQYRTQLVDYLNSHISELYSTITGEPRTFSVKLNQGFQGLKDLTATLAAAFGREHILGYTLSGPHRDDLEVLSENKPIVAVLSQGQMRSTVIALKLVVQRFLKTITGEQPLVLLDEALSELDEKRQEILLANLPQDTQVLLTCTKIPNVLQERENVHYLDLRSIIASAKLPQRKLEAKKDVVSAVEFKEQVGVVAS